MSLVDPSIYVICLLVAVCSAIATAFAFNMYRRSQARKALGYLGCLLNTSCDINTLNGGKPVQAGFYNDVIKVVEEHQVDLVEFLRILAVDVDKQAIGTANISHFIDGLGASIKSQSLRAENITSVADKMASTTTVIAESARSAGSAAAQTSESCATGMQAVEELIHNFDEMDSTVESVASALAAVQQQSKDVQGIADVINTIAEQTNLLALNAAIEAARAGEAGRGFSVVADEVRGLASQTTKATSEIAIMLTESHGHSEKASKVMADLVGNMSVTLSKVKNTGQTLGLIAEQAEKSDSEIQIIINSMDDQVRSSNEVSEAVGEISSQLSKFEVETRKASEDGGVLSEMAENIIGRLGRYDLGTLHDQIRLTAIETANQVGFIFEEAIESRRLSIEDVFDRNYKPIEGSNPQKYSTRFDSFTDMSLPELQEPIVQQYSEVLFAGAVDNNGYFPTHNKCYSQPLTGNYQTDLVNNRTKRIFDDRTGSRCGSNTHMFLLQTYKRDTGEVIHDLSAPIYVNGRHWGGFRIGYKTSH